MGNQDSTITTAAPEPIENLQLTHLGPLTLMRSAQGFCLLKVFSFTDSFLMEERLRKFKTRVSKIAENAHVLTMYSVNKLERKELCANNYQLHVFLERPGTTLREVIAQRLRDKQNFTQQELFSFLGRLVNTLLYIQDNGLKNIQIDSQAILFCGDNVKVMDCAIACSRTYFQLLERREKGLECEQSDIYLAPELLKQLKELNYDPYISPKADIFSIGMLLLEMVTLQPMLGYYDYAHAAIDYDSLIHRLSRISHSLPLKTLLAEMLEYDPEERIGLVSLKEKIHRLQHPQAEQAQIARSKSSKMLKQILSQSRKSGSLSRQGQNSAALSRQQSTQRKTTSRIELHCNSGKKLDLKDIQNKQQSSKKQENKKQEQQVKKDSSMINVKMDQGIDQVQFKNLVKNRLIKQKEKNKQNAPNADIKPSSKAQQAQKTAVVETRLLLERNNNRIDTQNSRLDSLRSSKFDSGATSKILESSLGYNQASLCKLVEESGIKHLLKLQHLNQSGFKKSQPESMKNTSRFGQPSDLKDKSQAAKPLSLRKISQIYIREEDETMKADAPIVTAREPITQERQLQKVMTFNNKEFLISARSVERSVQQPQPNHRQERLVFSPIAPSPQLNENSSLDGSPQPKITIKDIPVVISQQKVYQPVPPQNFGRLQRNLHLLDCAQSIDQDTVSNDGFSSSKVIESFKPQGEDNYRSVGIANSKVQAYNHENSCFLKKNKPKKPQLNIQLNDDEDDHFNNKSFEQKSRNNQISETPYQKQPAKSKLAKLDHLYRTSQSIEQFSNFTSISPPQDSKDSNSTFQLLFERKEYLQREENTSSSLLKKANLGNGDSYQGQLSPEGLPHGNGILESTQGYQYSGSFMNGKFHGFGTLINHNYQPSPVDYRCIDLAKGYWTRFQGEFENGTKTGFGTIFFQQGEKFSGCLKKDVIEGYGCFYKKTKELISGLWSQNKFRKI